MGSTRYGYFSFSIIYMLCIGYYSLYINFSHNYLNILEDNVCPSSIAAWFYNQDYSVHLCKQRFFQRSKYSLTIPILQDEYDIDRFFEWLGIFSIDGDLYVSSRFKIIICP